MTDTLLALVPTYGAWLILASLILSCLALPVPSSILVMAAGAFASAGDMALWQVQIAAFGGFAAGDQAAYAIARAGGSRFIDRLKKRPKIGTILHEAQALLTRHGVLAVFLSRTVLSPLGPYTGYLSGALRLHWVRFTCAALAGAACWCMAYSLLGYFFASHVALIANMVGNALGFILSGAVLVCVGWFLLSRWRADRHAQSG